MKQYVVEITDEALVDMERFRILDSEPEHSKEIRRMLVDNYLLFRIMTFLYIIDKDLLPFVVWKIWRTYRND